MLHKSHFDLIAIRIFLMFSIARLPKLFDYDLIHFGELCKQIREIRGISPSSLANLCNKISSNSLNRSTISRDLEEKGGMRRENFDTYLRVLQLEKDSVIKKGFPFPLSERQAQFVLDLYTNRSHQKLVMRECELVAINFNDIRNRRLDALVDELRQERRPALIMDDLWFIHAINGSYFNLIGLQSSDNENPNYSIFNEWYGWHHIGTKINCNPLARQSCQNPSVLLTSLKLLFEDQRASVYLFTNQMRLLIYKIGLLSKNAGYDFDKSWALTTSFMLPTELKLIHYRSIYSNTIYEFKTIMEKSALGERNVQYTLTVLQPLYLDTNELLSKIEDHTVYYASDYEKRSRKQFHVNEWEEIAAITQGLPCVQSSRCHKHLKI